MPVIKSINVGANIFQRFLISDICQRKEIEAKLRQLFQDETVSRVELLEK
jgi:hypothetical protein